MTVIKLLMGLSAMNQAFLEVIVFENRILKSFCTKINAFQIQTKLLLCSRSLNAIGSNQKWLCQNLSPIVLKKEEIKFTLLNL